MKINSHYLKFFAKSMDSFNLIFDENLVREKLLLFDSPKRLSIKDSFFTNSAILFAIVPHSDKPYELIIIHRANKGAKHRGEMSFPGGKFDFELDKTLKDTALRECEEEIGVKRDKIKILGCLHDFPTMTQFVITPFVGIIRNDQKLVKDDREVQEIIKVPINFFLNKKNFRETAMEFEGKPFPVFFFNYKNKRKSYMIWGATAYMIATFIKMVYNYEISDLGLRRFTIEEIKPMKEYILDREKFNNHLKNVKNNLE